MCYFSSSVFRCLGIPSRVTTNFNSAHDNDGNIKTDIYVDQYGSLDNSRNRDSVWWEHYIESKSLDSRTISFLVLLHHSTWIRKRETPLHLRIPKDGPLKPWNPDFTHAMLLSQHVLQCYLSTVYTEFILELYLYLKELPLLEWGLDHKEGLAWKLECCGLAGGGCHTSRNQWRCVFIFLSIHQYFRIPLSEMYTLNTD